MSVPTIEDEAKASAARQAAAGSRGWPATVWQQIRGFVADVNYVARRVIELQIPWSARDERRR
jgi:nucleotidyltransferase/DNA polymerase involved in DNA repair